MNWYRKNISINWLKGLISLTAVIAIAIRILYPQLRIDVVTLGLMILAVFPWLTELIESAKFPGGWEIKFRDVRAAGEKITAASGTVQSVHQPKPAPSKPTFISVAEHDPNLALVGLRIEIEVRLNQLAERYDIPIARRSLGSVIAELRKHDVLHGSTASGLQELVLAGNRAAHGASVEPRVAEWAINNGPDILATLDDLLTKLHD